MARTQIFADAIQDESIESIDIKDGTIKLEDLSQEVIDAINQWGVTPTPFKENLIVTDWEYSPSDMTHTPNDYNLLQVFLNWQLQREWTNEDYTVSWLTITFADTLKNKTWRQDKVTVIYYY